MTPEEERYTYLKLKQKQSSFESPQISGAPAMNPTAPGNTMAAEDIIPTAGATILGAMGTPLGAPGIIAGSTIGGFAGQGIQNLIRGARSKPVPQTVPLSLAESGMEGAKQGAAATLGMGLGKAIPPVAKFVGRRIGDVEGVLTGSSGAVREAAKAGLEGGQAQKALIGTMRGSVTEKQTVNDALDSLQVIKQARGKAYVKQMEDIQAKSFQKKINLDSIKTKLDDLLNDYNIGRTKDGTLDFSRAALDDPSIADVKRMAETVDNWGSRSGDNTIKGLDILKRKIDDFYSPSGEARAFVSSLRNKVKSTIVDAVPSYEKLTSQYEKASEAIKDISKELSMGANSNSGTIMRKLQQTLRQNFDLRKEFVDVLDKAGKRNVMEQIAGVELNPVAPKGLMRVGGAMGLGASIFNPKILPFLPLTSPRFAGETALKVGQAARYASKGLPLVRPFTQGMIGAGRQRLPINENQ